jgi:hydrogenase/urease accessory protein HupE
MRSPSTNARKRAAVALTLVPPATFLVLVLAGDRVHPLLAGVPFFPAALVLWTLLAALCLALAARLLGPGR